MNKRTIFFLTLVFLISCSGEEMKTPYTNVIDDDRMLIVIAAPPANTEYYYDVYDQIIEFDITYAKKVMGKDNILILADDTAYSLLAKELPTDILLKTSTEQLADIWMRDFTTVNPHSPVQFRYTKAAQAGSQDEADYVQASFNQLINTYNIELATSDFFLDGGNIVDNYNGKFILTDRFLTDNSINKEEAKKEIRHLFGQNAQIAIIPSDGTSLAHVDGMLMFIDQDTIAMNTFDGPLRSNILTEIESSFSDITIIEISPEYDDTVWDKKFESACGLAVNSVLTNDYLYVPQFGKSSDTNTLHTIQKNTQKTVVPIDAQGVCKMGGSVRCLSWQLVGKNAEELIRAARNTPKIN